MGTLVSDRLRLLNRAAVRLRELDEWTDGDDAALADAVLWAVRQLRAAPTRSRRPVIVAQWEAAGGR